MYDVIMVIYFQRTVILYFAQGRKWNDLSAKKKKKIPMKNMSFLIINFFNYLLLVNIIVKRKIKV